MKQIAFLLSAGLLSACASVPMDVPDTIADPAVDVANAPLETLNIRKIEIPRYFAEMTHPYKPVGGATVCEDIQSEIQTLNDFLGPDHDHPNFDNEDKTDAGDLAKMIIPYGGPIRFLSGASAHQKEVLRVARLGIARRAYLKGQGEAAGCKYPAAPRD